VTFSVLALSFLACSDKGIDTAGGDTGPVGCEVEAEFVSPTSGQADFYYRGFVEASLSDPDASASLTIDGVDGTSELSDDQETVRFYPSAPLASSTSYTANLSWCDGEQSGAITFSTSELGESAEASGLVGNTYSLDLASGRIIIPEGVGTILESYLDYTLYMGVSAADEKNITFIGATADEDNPSLQDYCTETLGFPTADFTDNPFFQIGPETTTLDVAGFSIEIQDLNVSGALAPGGDWIGGATLSGSIDTRPLGELLDSTEDGAICELVQGFGVECEPCSDGLEYCLSIYVVDLSADLVSDLTLEEVGESDCHVNCASNSKECDLGDGGQDTGTGTGTGGDTGTP